MAALFKMPGSRNSSEDPEEFRATLVEHLEELRTRILRIVWMLVIAVILAYYFIEPWLYDFLNGMVNAQVAPVLAKKHIELKIVWDSITGPFMLKLKLSFYVALIAVAPFAILQVWGFVSPALKPNEKKPFKVLAPLSVLLFALGASFAWWVTPNALRWFASYVEDFPGTGLYLDPNTFILLVVKLLLAFGLSFELPLIVYALGAIGLLQAGTLIKYWRQATTVIFIISAVLTPSNDAFTMLMMAVPMCILFMISVYAVKITQARKKKKDAAKSGE